MDDRLVAALAARPAPPVFLAAMEAASAQGSAAEPGAQPLSPPPTPPALPAVDDEGGAEDGDAPEWPDEAVESAMRAEHQDRDGSGVTLAPAPVARAAEETEPELPLPALDSLIAQIPAEVRETLEDLFRARFTSVQRVPKTALKS